MANNNNSNISNRGSNPQNTPFQLPSSWPPPTDTQSTGNLWATAGQSTSWRSGNVTSVLAAPTAIGTVSSPLLPAQVTASSSTNQFPGLSSTPQANVNIFTNTFTQETQGNVSNPFGGGIKEKPEVANVFGSGMVSGKLGAKVDTSATFRVHGASMMEKAKSESVSGSQLSPNTFDRVSSSDSGNASGNIFGNVSSSSTISKVFGGGTENISEIFPVEKSKEVAEVMMARSQVSTSHSAGVGSNAPSLLSVPSTVQNLFGGVASSATTTEAQFHPPSSSAFGGVVDSSPVTAPNLFGGLVDSSSAIRTTPAAVKPSISSLFSGTMGSTSVLGGAPATPVVVPVFGGSVSSSVTSTVASSVLSGPGPFSRTVSSQSADSATRNQLPSLPVAVSSGIFGGGKVELAKGKAVPVFSDSSVFRNTTTAKSLADVGKKEKLFGATSTSDLPVNTVSSVFGGTSLGPQSSGNIAAKSSKQKLFGKTETSASGGSTTEPAAGESEEPGEIPSSTVATSTSVPVFSVSSVFASTTTSKSTSSVGRSSSEQQEKPFAAVATSSFPYSAENSLFGGTSSVTQSPGNTAGKSGKQSLFSKTEAKANDSSETTLLTSQEEELEPGEIPDIKPDIIPELFGKSETQLSSQTSPEFARKELTKIIVAQIPDSCMDKEVLKRHFEKFGEIKRLMLVSKSNQALIQYRNHHSASKAKRKGRKIHPKLPEVKIFYGTPARRKSEEGSSDAMSSKKKAIRTLQHAHTPSELDPYTPLERPGTSSASSSSWTYGGLPLVLPRHSDSASSRLSRNDRLTPRTVRPARDTSRPQKVVHSKVKSHRPKPSTPDKLAVPETKQPVRPKSPARDSKESLFQEVKNSKALLDIQASTNYQKFMILKARDQFLQKERTRPTDLKMASFLAATCPDMCPEMERYMRDVQSDLSSYEMTNGKLDHRLAIKAFSRSSADKETPLPHELRPGSVLLQTMDFLMCNVINRGDDEGTGIDVWYSYLWNRTRAIRNDMTMQQLTSSVGVAIMERCARFHIHSAARLCAEPADVFDAKMNTEHLTKCLQSLKELYHDLGEMGEFFDTESEFRAYEMLLNLNDGETIVTRYSQYREEVQKSSHVQFARKVFHAITFNNYVKFFKLIRNASYLQGCLLNRYFRQVRSRALDTLMKSYVPTKTPQMVPLQTLVQTLGFESEEDSITYLRYHGIRIEDNNAVLDKYSFTLQPKEMPPVVRPVNLVEVNLSCSVGEVIQGGPIPDNPLHTHVPHDSFNSEGYLRPEAINASDQNISSHKVTVVVAPLASQQPVRLENSELVFYARDVYNTVESSVRKEMASEVCRDCIEDCKIQEKKLEENAREVLHTFIEDYCRVEFKDVGKVALREVEKEEEEAQKKRKEKEEKRRKAAEELQNTVALSVHSVYVTEFVDEFSSQICQEALQEVETSVALEDFTEELSVVCCNEVTLEETNKISEELLEELVLEQEAKIIALQHKIALRQMGESFRKWRMEVFRARRKKQAQETFPAACSQLTIREQNEALGWSYNRDRKQNMSAFCLSRLEMNLTRTAEKLMLRNQLVRECAWHPLLLEHHAMKNADKLFPERNLLSQYFKVLVCTADSCTDSAIIQWLRSKLGSGNTNIQEPLSHNFSFVSRKTGVEYGWVLHEASANSLSAEDIRGTSLLLYLTSLNDAQDPQYSQIQDLCKTMPWTLCYTVLYNCNSSDIEGWNLFEEDLLKPETSKSLLCLLLEFWKKVGTQNRVVSSCLNNFIYGFVAEKYVSNALQQQNDRLADGKSPIPPSALIDLYNAVICFLIKVIEDEELQSLDWPPPELNNLCQIPASSWNSSDVRCNSELVGDLKLPELKVEGIMNWKNLSSALHNYAGKVASQHDGGIGLISHFDTILSNTQKILGPIYDFKEEDNLDCELHVLQFPWTELVYACVSHKLTGLPDTKVFYQPEKLKSFMFPQSWWTACDSSDPVWLEAVKENCPPGSRKRKADKQDQFVCEQSKVQKVPSKLLRDIADEKQKCEEFERKLESLLDIDEDLNFLWGIEI